VHANTNPKFHALISCFKERSGCGVLVNTSFNVRGEPIVCTPEDAFRCFMGTEIDLLVAGNCLLKKEEQDLALRRDYRSAFQLD
jgi:carbamoyltransferase